MNDYHDSNNATELPHISTEDLIAATDHVDALIATIREARDTGADLDTEKLTMLELVAITTSGSDDRDVIVSQALLLAITLQRLA